MAPIKTQEYPFSNQPQLLDIIAELFHDERRKTDVAALRQQKGGWESWLQCVIANACGGAHCWSWRREEPIFRVWGQVDIWLEPFMYRPFHLSQPYAVGIELKCEHEGNDPRKAFLKDVEKVMNGIKPEYVGRATENPGEGGCQCDGTYVLCLMVTTKERDLEDLDKGASADLKSKVAGEVFYRRRVLKHKRYRGPTARGENHELKDAEGPIDLWLAWWSKGWARPAWPET